MRLVATTVKHWFLTILLILATQELQAQENALVFADEAATYQEELAKRDRLIAELQSRYEDLERRVRQFEANTHGRLPSDKTDRSASLDNPTILPQDVSPEAVERLRADDRTEQDRLIRSAFENTLIDRGGLLLPSWSYDLEPSLNYIHSSSENIVVDGFTIFPVLVVGDIVSEKLTRDINLLNLTFRLGLPWDSQAEIRIPYGHQKLRSASGDGTEREFNDNGLGDIELTFAHQLYKSTGKWPDVVANLRWKSITGDSPFSAAEGDIFVGSGFHATNLSINAVKVIDPVVYFAGLAYTHNNSTVEEIGKFDPGDSWGLNLGIAIALNLNNSLSFAYDQQFTKKSKLDGVPIPGSYSSTGVFSIGTSFLMTDRLTVDFSLGIGITEDSPDLLLTTSFPLRGDF
jgi:hypothetical protein